MLSFLTLQADLPEHLTPRTTSESMLVLVLFVVCILLAAIARYSQKRAFLYLFQAIFFLKPLDELSKESYKIRSTASFLFTILFLLVSAGAVYWLFFLRTPLSDIKQLLIPLFVPGLYFVYQFIMSNMAARIGGNATVLQDFNYFTLLLTQFFGLLIFIELFVSYFQPAFITRSVWTLVITYALYLLIRFLRGFWIVMNRGVRWYYIILYFWTLEILPLLIVAKLLYYEEFQDWID